MLQVMRHTLVVPNPGHSQLCCFMLLLAKASTRCSGNPGLSQKVFCVGLPKTNRSNQSQSLGTSKKTGQRKTWTFHVRWYSWYLFHLVPLQISGCAVSIGVHRCMRHQDWDAARLVHQDRIPLVPAYFLWITTSTTCPYLPWFSTSFLQEYKVNTFSGWKNSNPNLVMSDPN